MYHIKQKLQSCRGASILLALIYLLLCITIGTIVITAASTSAKHGTDSWKTEQNYQAIASATELLTVDLGQAIYTGSYQKTETSVYYPAIIDENNKITTNTHTMAQEPIYTLTIPETSITNSKLLTTLEKTAADNDFDLIYRSTLPPDASPAYQVFTADETYMQYPLFFEALENLPAVTGTLTIQNKAGTTTPLYTITALLWIEADGKKLNTTTLVFAPVIIEQTPVVDINTISDDASTTTITTTTYTSQVHWTAPLVTKGGAAE